MSVLGLPAHNNEANMQKKCGQMLQKLKLYLSKQTIQ